jgi:transcriptional regulator with XRE-family HTH domain
LSQNSRLKKIRELKNFSQDYVAERLKITTRAYSKIETGETKLTIQRLNQISIILGISAMDILQFNPEKVFL